MSGISRRPPQWILGLVVGLLAGLLLRRNLSSTKPMPHTCVWQKTLSHSVGGVRSARLLTRAGAIYDELREGAPRPGSLMLRLHLRHVVLPSLALYRALLEDGMGRQAALAEMERLPLSVTAGLRRLLPLLGTLPGAGAFALFRVGVNMVMRFVFPRQAWQREPVEEAWQCVGFDIRRCFYLDTLADQGAPELTRLYCAQDDLLFATLPSSIAFHRAGTLARGSDRCDFRWCLAEAGP